MQKISFAVLMMVVALPHSLSAGTISLPAARDTAVHQQSINVNSGGQGSLSVGKVGGTFAHVLYQFDVSSLDGLYQSIDSITLRAFVSNNTDISNANSNPGLNVTVHEISAANANWIEGNKSFTTASTGEPTWANRQHSSTAWAGSQGLSTAGDDYVTTPLSSINIPSTVAIDEQVNFNFTGDLTALIDSWQILNPGLVLIPNSPSSTDRVFFRSREVLDNSLHPMLIVTYTELPPIPEPSTSVLLGLGVFALSLRKRFARKGS